jgi:hypothetical protein
MLAKVDVLAGAVVASVVAGVERCGRAVQASATQCSVKYAATLVFTALPLR